LASVGITGFGSGSQDSREEYSPLHCDSDMLVVTMNADFVTTASSNAISNPFIVIGSLF
jgi:hypothetical protein